MDGGGFMVMGGWGVYGDEWRGVYGDGWMDGRMEEYGDGWMGLYRDG